MQYGERRAPTSGVIGIRAIIIREAMHIAGEYDDVHDLVVADEVRDLGALGRMAAPTILAKLRRRDPRVGTDPENERETVIARGNQFLLEPCFLGRAHARL